MKDDNNESNLGSELDLDIIFDVEAEREKTKLAAASKKTAERSSYIDDDDMRAVVGGLLKDDAKKGSADDDADYSDYINQTSKSLSRDSERARLSRERMEKRRADAMSADKPINRTSYEPDYRGDALPGGKQSGLAVLMGDIKYLLLAVIFVFLLILMFFVFKIRSLNSQLQTALASNTGNISAQDELTSLRLENEGLSNANKALQIENEDLRTLLRSSDGGVVETSGDGTDETQANQTPVETGQTGSGTNSTTSGNSNIDSGTNTNSSGETNTNNNNNTNANTNTNTNANANGGQNTTTATQAPAVAKPKTHTVVKGDTLWKLAEYYLEDAKRYNEFVIVNNLKNENDITEGQVLIIP